MTSPSERRRAPRALADFPISLSPDQGSTPARLKDLSTIGLCCTTAAEIDEMVQVCIDLQLPGNSTRHRVEGAVVRCEPASPAEDGYEVAVYFTTIDDSARSAVASYVAQAAPA